MNLYFAGNNIWSAIGYIKLEGVINIVGTVIRYLDILIKVYELIFYLGMKS